MMTNQSEISERLSDLSLQKDEFQTKRKDAIEWNEYFMGIAILASKRSKDPNCQVGACIVNEENIVVGIGYNGMPLHCSDDVFPWSKNSIPLRNKHMYVCHAEMNAIINKNSHDVKGCTIYVCLFPCNECAKIIIQSRIKKVVYLSDKKADDPKYQASRKMFQAAGVDLELFSSKRDKIEINFDVHRD